MSICAQCGEENPDRARFCLGCGAPLASVCPACGEENPPHARFCLACGGALGAAAAASAPTPRELRKTVTVVFCDVTGSTTIGERIDPESLRRVMSRYFDEMRAALERHGGTVEKFIGDAVVAVFGIPAVHEDDALRAVRAAAEMRRARDKLNEELERTWGVRIQARTGVNTGEVVAGDAAMGQRFATGDTMNVAARLEQAAAPGEILIGEDTFHLVRDAVRVEPVAPLALKGKADPVPAYQLIDVDLWAPGYTRRLDSPLVGRRRELEVLRSSAETLTGATLTTVLGAAGLGKSRLTNEFLSTLDGFHVLRGRCLSYGEGVSFWPVMEIVHAAAAITEHDTPEAARAKLGALLREEPLAAERVAAAIGLGEGTGSAEETFWGVRKLLEALAAESPVAILIDDCHWAAPAMLDLIEYVTGWSGAAPIMILCLARPELLEARPSWPTSVALEPLSAEESEQLLDNLLGGETVASDVRQRILETAEGNPLYIEQLVALVREGGEQVAIPPTIHALVAARLDRLAVEERSTIERGAIEGKVFHRGAVQHLTPEQSRAQVSALLLTLVRKELIGPDESVFTGDDAFRFRNLVVRDAAYEAMPKQARAELHERFVEWLEAVVGDRAREVDEIVAHHLEQAHRYLAELGPIDEHGRALAERAAVLYGGAARQAQGRGDIAAARYLLARAVDLFPSDDPRRIELLPELGSVLAHTGEFGDAEATFAEAIDSGHPRVATHAEVERAFMRMSSAPEGAPAAALDVAERAIRLFDQLGDDAGLAGAWRLLALRHWVLGEAEQTTVALEHGVRHAQRAGRRGDEVDCLSWLAWAARYGPTPALEGLRVCDEIDARADGDPTVTAATLTARAAFNAMLGEFETAREWHHAARGAYAELGQRVMALASAMSAGAIELAAGDGSAAERLLQPAYDELDELGERGYLSAITYFLGEALLAQGRIDEAALYARRTEELASTDDLVAQAQWRALSAKVHALRGEFSEAERLAREATAITGETQLLEFDGDMHAALAQVLALAGREDEAAGEWRAALERYERKGHLAAAARTREQLERIAV